MRKQIVLASRADAVVCPACGIEELCRHADGIASCDGCELLWDRAIVEEIGQIASLPDAAGDHPCECGHPEMRLLPDGVFHCPSCGSEVLPIQAASGANSF